MEKFAYKLENLIQEKLKLYEVLKTIFQKEKKYIVDIDVDSLWRMTGGKNQIASDIEQIRGQILHLLKENNLAFDMDLKSFSLSGVIDSLPFSIKIKSDLKKICLELDIIKRELASIASENKRYASEYLSVINGIFSTITDSQNREQYTKAGMVSKGNTAKRLIRAEV